jgi:hypothetical protein
MSLEVKPYYDVAGSIITYNNIDYNLNEIPNEFMLRFDAISEKTEQVLINLLNDNTTDSKEELRSIMADMAVVFDEEIKINKFFNTFDTKILNPGEGMNWTSENPKLFNTKIIVINMGSSIVLTLKNKLGKMIDIYLPRRSMFLLDDPKSDFLRGISSRTYDIVQNKKYNREKRYSLYFTSKKK